MKTLLLMPVALLALAGCKPHDHLTDHGQSSATPAAPVVTPTEIHAANAEGTIESVDIAANRIVIAHGPVDALGWPAMTMGFKATPEQIASVQPGQSVRFEFTAQGMAATITRIEPSP